MAIWISVDNHRPQASGLSGAQLLMVLSIKRETALNIGPVLSANAWVEAVAEGKVWFGFRFMNLYRDMVSANTDHALVIFVCL